MEKDKVEVGAVLTDHGWMVVSMPRTLVVEALRHAMVLGEVTLNGIGFKLRTEGPRLVT